ncbi:MAG: dihydroorotase [Acidimicrobiia bacterium]
MVELIIKDGSVFTDDGMVRLDVRIVDGRIAELAAKIDGPTTIDASDAWVGPGFVDIHTHLRDPGELWKEDIGTGTAAAAAGGYTAVVAMPNTVPTVDNAQTATYVSERGRTVGSAEVRSAGAITLDRVGQRMAHIDEMWQAGVRVFTDDGTSVASSSVLRLAMEYVKNLGGVVAQHAVDGSMSSNGHMHEGAVSSRLGMAGIPSEAEEIVIARDLTLVRLTGVNYHAQHLSTARGVELISAAKSEGLPVTAEVTPHHLEFDHTDVTRTDPAFKMMPPLRTAHDRLALADGLRSGAIDIVATDHAPHAAREKEVPFEDAPNGVLGLEWAGSVARNIIGMDPTRFFEAMAVAPARIAQIPDQGLPIAVGNVANITVFRPMESWTPTATRSRSRNAPYFGMSLTGRPTATIFNGRVTHGAAI